MLKIENNRIVNKGLNMVLECEKLAKEDRTKCVSEYRRDNRKVEGNIVLKHGR